MVRDYVHKALGMYVAHLEEPESGAEGKLQIMINGDACPHCGNFAAKDNLGDFDPNVAVMKQIKERNKAHQQMDAWAAKHRKKVRKR